MYLVLTRIDETVSGKVDWSIELDEGNANADYGLMDIIPSASLKLPNPPYTPITGTVLMII